jgi:hypothetical protein
MKKIQKSCYNYRIQKIAIGNIVFILLAFSCSNSSGPAFNFLYNPAVTLSGYFNGSYYNLCGNYYWQNKCFLNGDTIMMYFYSEDFSEQNRIRTGDMVRMEIYPGNDHLIGTKQTLFHMTRYRNTVTTYNVDPSDTITSREWIEMSAASLGRVAGLPIEIDSVKVCAVPVTSGEQLSMIRGHISGTIQ